MRRGCSGSFFRRFPACFSFLLIFLLSALLPLSAAYLRNIPQTLRQPDGAILRCFATGDEYCHWLHDRDGYTIVLDPLTGYFVYAVRGPAGALVPTRFLPGRSDPRLLGLEKGLLPPPAERLAIRNLLSRVSAADGPRPAPKFGSLNNIVVFIRFSGETEYADALSTYDNMFNLTSIGANSMVNYFLEASYNALSATSTFYPAPGATVVSYQDANPRGYYQPYNVVSNPVGYQGGDYGSERTTREHTLLKNAVNAISAGVPAELAVDGDADGFVDNICFVVRGEPTGWASLLWPHQWALYTEEAYINSKRVYTYDFQLQSSILSSGVGVLCHEMCHSLGLPDLYHYSYDGIHPVYTWDIMEYNRNPPQHMGAYMKFRYTGWIASLPEITASGTYTLNPLTSPTGNAFKILSPYSANEYFVLEYRRRTGTFESSLGGQGLLVYRINASCGGAGNSDGPPDEVYLYRPNGTTSSDGNPASAHFGAGVERTSINDATNPSSFLSGGAAGGLRLSNIGTAGSTISFRVDIGVPTIGLSRAALSFGAAGSATTKAQTISIRNVGDGEMAWTASSPQAWISVSPPSGAGASQLSVSVDPAGLAKGTHTGTVNITAPGADNSPRSVTVTLKVYTAGATASPFGVFDTPVSGSTVKGSLPVTGWALDDIEVAKVDLRRVPVAGDPPAAIDVDGLVYLGEATLVDGARPDVETAQPGYPLNYRAGWGFMLLTYGLPAQGNGTFVLHAVAYDKEGRRQDLGTKTIHSDNAHNTDPFGAIDTPAQGGTVSGAIYINFGWVLTPPPASIPTDGSTIWLWIDGAAVGHPAYNNYRSDVHDAFPGYANADGAVGYSLIDTTAYENDIHTIAWSAADSLGREGGMGSRYFWVFNGGEPAGSAAPMARERNAGTVTRTISRSARVGSLCDLTGIPADGLSPIHVRKGFRDTGRGILASPDEKGLRSVVMEEAGRIAIALDSPADLPRNLGRHASSDRWRGYLVVGEELRPLPVGSTLDSRNGVFLWQPGPGFLGTYRFEFLDRRTAARKSVAVVIKPKTFPTER